MSDTRRYEDGETTRDKIERRVGIAALSILLFAVYSELLTNHRNGVAFSIAERTAEALRDLPRSCGDTPSDRDVVHHLEVYSDRIDIGIFGRNVHVDDAGWPLDPWQNRFRIDVGPRPHPDGPWRHVVVTSPGSDGVFGNWNDIQAEFP